MFSSHFMLYPTSLEQKFSFFLHVLCYFKAFFGIKKYFGGGGGSPKISYFMFYSHFMLSQTCCWGGGGGMGWWGVFVKNKKTSHFMFVRKT